MNTLYNYKCSLAKAVADAQVKSILSFKWGDAIYEANESGKYKQKTQIIDVVSYSVEIGICNGNVETTTN